MKKRKSSASPVSVVTGGAGFLGSHLADHLLAKGHRVVAIDNFVTGAVDNIAHLAGNPDFKFIQQDVTEFLFLDGSVNYVWHFASPASPIDYLELPIQTLKVGSLGTHKALGLAKEKGAAIPYNGFNFQKFTAIHFGSSATRGLLGKRQYNWPARLLR